jgi:hypothetical protein
MNPEQQRIAIAEKCLMTQVCKCHYCGEVGHVPLLLDGNGNHSTEIPDYLNDLNAMHEAEKTLDPKGNDGKYEYWLRTVCQIPERESAKGRYFYRATAAQRAESFLRALGLWKDEE